MKRILCIVTAVMLLLMSAAFAEDMGTVRGVSGDSYIRRLPNRTGEKIGVVLRMGETAVFTGKIEADERGVEWYSVRCKGKDGWVSSMYTDLNANTDRSSATSAPTGERLVTAGSLKLGDNDVYTSMIEPYTFIAPEDGTYLFLFSGDRDIWEVHNPDGTETEINDYSAGDIILDYRYTSYTETGFTVSLMKNEMILVSVGNMAGETTITIRKTDETSEAGSAPEPWILFDPVTGAEITSATGDAAVKNRTDLFDYYRMPISSVASLLGYPVETGRELSSDGVDYFNIHQINCNGVDVRAAQYDDLVYNIILTGSESGCTIRGLYVGMDEDEARSILRNVGEYYEEYSDSVYTVGVNGDASISVKVADGSVTEIFYGWS